MGTECGARVGPTSRGRAPERLRMQESRKSLNQNITHDIRNVVCPDSDRSITCSTAALVVSDDTQPRHFISGAWPNIEAFFFIASTQIVAVQEWLPCAAANERRPVLSICNELVQGSGCFLNQQEFQAASVFHADTDLWKLRFPVCLRFRFIGVQASGPLVRVVGSLGLPKMRTVVKGRLGRIGKIECGLVPISRLKRLPLITDSHCYAMLSSLTLTAFTSKSDKVQTSPAASPEILHCTVWRTWLFISYSDERLLYYRFSLEHLYIFPERFGRM